MDSSDMITAMILICLIFMGFVLFSKPIKVLLRFCVQAVLGLVGTLLLNFLLSPLGLTVGLNYLTGFLLGILGLPGLISLYIMQGFL